MSLDSSSISPKQLSTTERLVFSNSAAVILYVVYAGGTARRLKPEALRRTSKKKRTSKFFGWICILERVRLRE